MPGRMEFQFELPRSASRPRRRDSDAPLRVLVMADFSGRAQRETPAALLDLASRALLTVNADNLDAIMARLTPKLRLAMNGGSGGAALTIGFAQIDDFHPDALYQRLELFQSLRRSRARLLNPASFAQAVAELSPTPPQESAKPEPATEENDSALLERLLGKTPDQPPPARPADVGAAAINTLLQAVVQPHIVRTDPRQEAWVEAVDAAIGEQLRAILHQPAFQALEAAWRGVQGLVASLDSDVLRVDLLDVTKQELLADLRTAAGQPRATSLYTLLIDREVQLPDSQPWSLLVGDYAFGATPDDIALLAALGSVAAHAGGPFLAAADPSVLGCASTADLADPAQWAPLPAAAEQDWRALRQTEVAPWLGLTLPRVLLRLPYGRKTEPVEQLEFEEMPLGRDPDAYLWGNPAFACARLIAAAFAENGWDFSPGDVLELDDLPAHVYGEAEERLMQLGAEVLLGERAMQALLARGIMPLLGHRQRNAVRLARFQSLADPPAALAGGWRE
ncbi:MAG: type VI secretion system contractile sheath large subunit [Candidatus Competibacter sp.]|nr:type VI secretion system contractile sheath large subunit [Candidatus Competibacter sp.]MDG4582749.1 type VI secretion system contractile sheath large subunit [Candidatus Competibacter sp.]